MEAARPEAGLARAGAKPKPVASTRDSNKLTFKETKELEALPGKIEGLETEIAQIETSLADFKSVEETFRLNDLVSARRSRAVARPRQIAMYLAKRLTTRSLPEIGRKFGGRDHTTVMHAVKRITEMRQHDQDMNRQLHVLEQTLRG